METNVSTLLREFPKIRRAAFAGETVIIKTRDGNLRLSKDAPSRRSVLGCMKGQLLVSDDNLDQPTSSEDEWRASL